MTDQQADRWERYAQVPQVFTPGAPIDSLSLFAGRLDQVGDVINAVAQRGQHVVLYGERGVGKTSLANVLEDFFETRDLFGGLRSVRVNCGTNDEFYGIWQRIFRELELEREGLTPITPDDIRFVLRDLEPKLIVIDELDRLDDEDTISLLADTIKTLSDHSVPSTLMLVGVADSIDELVGDHHSVERALTQVLMPRMSRPELEEIIERGCDKLDLSVDANARVRIARLSEGLPYYTHLLTLHGAQYALMDERSTVYPGDVDIGIREGVQKAQASIKSAWQTATRSPRPESQFEQVLLACALAPKDELGYFTASAVRGPMSAIMNKPYEIPAFARHLNAFTTEARGSVLQKRGEQNRYFYRFENPLLQPFVILNGLAKALITEDLLAAIQGDGEPTSDETALPDPLF